MNNIIVRELKNLDRFTRHNAPTLLTVAGISGFVTTVVLAVKATPLAIDTLSELEEDWDPDKMTKKEMVVEEVKAVAPIYASTVIMGAASIACVIFANHMNNRRIISLVAAYSMSESNFREYKNKVIEKLGVKKEQEIEREVIQDSVTKNPPPAELMTAELGTLFREHETKKFFRCNKDDIWDKVVDLNARLVYEEFIELSDLTWDLDIEYVPASDACGFSCGDVIKPVFTWITAPNGEPCCDVDFGCRPNLDGKIIRNL